MLIRFSLSSLALTAALRACVPEGNVGMRNGDASPGTDVAVAPVDAVAMDDTVAPTDVTRTRDAGIGSDVVRTADTGVPTDVTVLPPSPDFAAAARVCALYDGCVGGLPGGVGAVEVCAETFAWNLNAAQYVAAFQGFEVPVTTYFIDDGAAAGIVQSAPPVRACLLTATTCDDVYRCMNTDAASTTCTPTSPVITCDGTVARTCAYPSDQALTEADSSSSSSFVPRTLAFDCASMGETCVHASGGATGPVGCAHAACDATSYVPSCAGGAPHNCAPSPAVPTQGFETVAAVCATGTTCQVGVFSGANQALCVGTGPACDEATFHVRCDGTGGAVSCRFGHEATLPCPGSSQCSVGGDGSSSCGYGPGGACTGSSSSCNAATGVISYCINGYAQTVDCRALGRAGCGAGALYGQPACL